MGILKEPAGLLKLICKQLPKGFSVLELGDQFVTYTPSPYLAREFYEKFGCGRYVCLDGNARNGALAVDLNEPVGEQLEAADLARVDTYFDLVTDMGTGEHIFDQRQVWSTLHGCCDTGGFIVFTRPIKGYPGHGFYLTDPSMFYDIAEANNYEVVSLRELTTTRGVVAYGAFRKRGNGAFICPHQGRYKKSLKPIALPRGL